MNIDHFFIHRENSLLLVIDIQERLYAAMNEKVRESVSRNTAILAETARVHGMPVIVSEQYRKGLGPTVTALAEKMGSASYLEKIHFDCMKDEALNRKIREAGKSCVIIAGMEAHVCVFQTALSLLKNGLRVVIAGDAVCSRRKHDWRAALAALAQAGALIYPTETVSFMILEKAGTPEFKALSPLFK